MIRGVDSYISPFEASSASDFISTTTALCKPRLTGRLRQPEAFSGDTNNSVAGLVDNTVIPKENHCKLQRFWVGYEMGY